MKEGSNISGLESHASPVVSECPDGGWETSVQAVGDSNQNGHAAKTKKPMQGKIIHS